MEFNDPFIDPVVAAKPLSHNEGDQAVLRIKDVDSTGFDIRIQEWDYIDGTHITETVIYGTERPSTISRGVQNRLPLLSSS